jgi:plastocyanin
MAFNPSCQFRPHVAVSGLDPHYTPGTCTVSAGTPLRFDFNPGGATASITGPQAPTRTFTGPYGLKVTFDAPGTYTWTITNSVGSASDTVTVTA